MRACDGSNAARTQLHTIAEGRWDDALCALLGVATEMLPEVHDSAHFFATTRGASGLRDGLPVASALGDSHAALCGHRAHGAGGG